MGTIKAVIDSTDKVMLPHKYNFQNNQEAVKQNTKLLKREKYDLTLALQKAKGTIMEPGSEFRGRNKLEPLLHHHEHWKKMNEIITTGLDYPLTDLPDKILKADVTAMIAQGNHKSATTPAVAQTLLKNYTKEVEHGWMLPVTLESVAKIKGAGVIPIGVAQQHTIDEKGKRYTKYRTTHDASFPPPSEQSINDRLIKSTLYPCYYGHYLIRILHLIHKMRLTHPRIRIFITKIDLDAAYRRIHVVTRMAALAITIIKRIAYILLRLPFGVANGPSDYSIVSETIFDLTNDILHDDTWDPDDVHSPLQPQFDTATSHYPPSTPFAAADPLMVTVPFHPAAADGYIDDIITVMLEIKNWVSKGQNAAPLAIHTIFRPTQKDDPIPRDDATSTRKLKGEGTPDEAKVVLGWLINTRRFRIYLPKDKTSDWISDIDLILNNKTTSRKALESTIGRLNHAGYIIPHGRYFINRLRHLLARCPHRGTIPINDSVTEDLKFWKVLLQHISTKGVNINNITFTEASVTTISDACEHGLGGYDSNGLAWRYALPLELQGIFSINLLEFIAAAITIYMTTRHQKERQRILAFTDSSSALGWLYKASFSNSQKAHNEVARWLAKLLMKKESSLYSQHIKGTHNFIADSLSRDHHIPTTQLTVAFHTLVPQQTPQNFTILTLPPEITSWLYSLRHLSTSPQASPQRQSRSKLGALTGGKDSLKAWELKMSGWRNTIQNNVHTSSQRLQALVDEIITVQQAKTYSPAKLSKPPSAMFVWPFGRIFGQTQLWTPTTSHRSTSHDNSLDS